MKHTESFFDFRARVAPSLVRRDAERGGGEGRGPSARPAAAPSSYLEYTEKHCDKVSDDHFEIASCGCRCRFCERCSVGLGLRLRERLIPILETFRDLVMWTFTVDPTLFSSPAAAYAYLREKRCLSVTMRELRRRGLVNSPRYFCVVEWQKETEMPHFHVIIDGRVPFSVMCDIWNTFRPRWAGPVQGDRPGFGSVRFSKPNFASARHAACYACKYLTKHPKDGFPDWVLDSSGEVHRYSTSRGFWGESSRKKTGVERDALNRRTRTVRERIACCGKSSAIMLVGEAVDTATGELHVWREFLGKVPIPLVELAAGIGVPITREVRRWDGLTASRALHRIALSADQMRAVLDLLRRSQKEVQSGGR